MRQLSFSRAGRPWAGPLVRPKRAAASALVLSLPALQAKRAANQRAVWAMVGDSVTAGWGSGLAVGTGAGASPGTGGNYFKSKSWPRQLSALLNDAGIPCRSDAYFSGAQSASTPATVTASDPAIVFGAGWTINTATSVGGLISYVASPDTTSEVFTPEYAADRFDLLVTGFSGLGTITVTDSSGLLATIDQGVTTGEVAFGGTCCRRVTVSRAVASALPISIQRNGTGGGSYVIGIIPYDTTSPRLEILNLGWPGSRAYGTTNSTPHWNVWSSGSSAWNPYYALGAINADAWSIELGANDAAAATSTANYQTAITNIANKLKTLGGDVALVKCHPSSGSFNLTAGYLTAIDTVTTNLSLRPVIDFQPLPLVTADFYDNIHLSQSGYAKEAAEAKRYLIGA